jgi:hypothetical protein
MPPRRAPAGSAARWCKSIHNLIGTLCPALRFGKGHRVAARHGPGPRGHGGAGQSRSSQASTAVTTYFTASRFTRGISSPGRSRCVNGRAITEVMAQQIVWLRGRTSGGLVKGRVGATEAAQPSFLPAAEGGEQGGPVHQPGDNALGRFSCRAGNSGHPARSPAADGYRSPYPRLTDYRIRHKQSTRRCDGMQGISTCSLKSSLITC